MKEQPLVSVVIPAYNSADVIGRCIDSLLSQTYDRYEIIVIDDGSIDATKSIVNNYIDSYSDVFRYYYQDNKGAGPARNLGIKEAKGEFLTFFDSDDVADRDYLETYVKVAIANNADVVCGGYRRLDSSGNEILRVHCVPGSAWAPYTIEAPYGKLYRTSFIRENDILFLDSDIIEDLYFTLKAALLAKHEVDIDYCGYVWTFNESSLTNTLHTSSKNVQFDRALSKLYEEAKELGASFEGVVGYYFVRLIAYYLVTTGKADGLHCLNGNMKKYRQWLDVHIPTWKSVKTASGDKTINRIAVSVFIHVPALFMGIALRGIR